VSEESSQVPATATLAERVRLLESRVTVLADAIGVLARGLEDIPTAEPGQRPAARAARRAYDLLLEAELRTPDGS
jgi:hypothetical protein